MSRIRDTAEVLRPELERPGGYHRRRAMGVAERLTGQRLGAAQGSALDAWSDIYGGTSDVLHGGPSSQARARYQQVLQLAREVFVPLPGRAAKVLGLTGCRIARLSSVLAGRVPYGFLRPAPGDQWSRRCHACALKNGNASLGSQRRESEGQQR
ncbi:hypothetical protein ACFYXH_36410 [Streptomyces sp. NPDC002730]|uniref:hypothetical protein n=1 Tax=Streptomyces sp. NPDC002730 TaxID=3364662 RepID=UPI0036B5709C